VIGGIQVGFVTDIDELMRQRRQERMAVRRAALIELSSIVAAVVRRAMRDVVRLMPSTRFREAAAGR
jgi:hypothetical protein